VGVYSGVLEKFSAVDSEGFSSLLFFDSKTSTSTILSVLKGKSPFSVVLSVILAYYLVLSKVVTDVISSFTPAPFSKVLSVFLAYYSVLSKVFTEFISTFYGSFSIPLDSVIIDSVIILGDSFGSALIISKELDALV